jgi:hypothetical protein
MEILEFEFDDEAFHILLQTEYGLFEVVADANQEGRTLHLIDLHVEGPGPNTIGTGPFARLARDFAQICLEYADADELVVYGFRRSTGANPGRVPRPLVFRR